MINVKNKNINNYNEIMRLTKMIIDFFLNNNYIPSVSDFEDFIYKFYKERQFLDVNHINLYHGASKGVIYFEDYDYVIKFPLYGGCVSSESYHSLKSSDSKKHKYAIDKYESFNSHFKSGDWVTKNWDGEKCYNYCEVEADNYGEAVIAGVDEFFCPIYGGESYRSFPLYFAKKCSSNPPKDYVWLSDDDVYEKYGELYDRGWDIDESLMESSNFANIIAERGRDKVAAMLDFIEEYNINDLHEDNMGFLNDKIVFIDYSGYGNY